MPSQTEEQPPRERRPQSLLVVVIPLLLVLAVAMFQTSRDAWGRRAQEERRSSLMLEQDRGDDPREWTDPSHLAGPVDPRIFEILNETTGADTLERLGLKPDPRLRKLWIRQLSQADCRSDMISRAAEEVLDGCLSEANSAWSWINEAYQNSFDPAGPRFVDGLGRLHALPAPGEDASLLRDAPQLGADARRALGMQWAGGFVSCVRWESTGHVRIRSDGAIEAEFELALNPGCCATHLPYRSHWISEVDSAESLPRMRDLSDPIDAQAGIQEPFAGDGMYDHPLQTFGNLLSRMGSDSNRRELIEGSFHQAMLRAQVYAWTYEGAPSLGLPSKWAVILPPPRPASIPVGN
jgi:hypothetical protein